MRYSVETTGAAGAALGIIVLVLAAYFLTFGLSIAMYVLQSLGMYTIAQRRGIKHPWMAWLPVTNMWILGSISDQYRYVVHGQIRNQRKVILILRIVIVALGMVVSGGYIAVLVDVLMQLPSLTYLMMDQSVLGGVIPALWVFGVAAAAWILGVIVTVLQYVCLHDLYASCNPKYKVLFLVLSILFNVTMPFFVFACRKKDLGMPPRRDEVVEQIDRPEPWETTEE